MVHLVSTTLRMLLYSQSIPHSVPPERRIGDFVHCIARVCNVLLKRLKVHAEGIGREAVNDLDKLCITLKGDADLIPPKGRLAARLTKPGEMDLTTARLLVETVSYHSALSELLKKHCPNLTVPWDPPRVIPAHLALALALRALHVLHALWRKKDPLTDSDVSLHEKSAHNLAKAWKAFNWKVTPWIHWTTSHSTHFAKKYKSIYLFSSIPTEMRHKTFKLDVRHAFLGGRRKAPARCAKGLTKLLDNDALDKGLIVKRLLDPSPEPQAKRSRRQ